MSFIYRLQISFAFLRNTFLQKTQINFLKINKYTQLDTKKLLIENAVLDTVTGYVFSRGQLVAGSTSWEPQHAIYRMPARPIFPRKVPISPICFLSAESYYHWLLEDLPSYLETKKRFPEAQTGIRKNSPPYVIDLLHLIDEPFMVLPISAKIRQIVIVPKPRALHPTKSAINSLQSLLPLVYQSGFKFDKIYISRKSAGRFPENEILVEELVLSLGFEIIRPEKFSLVEQVTIFNSARVIVGTHGAGLSNVVWCDPSKKARLVEIKLTNQPNCFEQISKLKGVEYFKVESELTQPWICDLENLRKLLSQT